MLYGIVDCFAYRSHLNGSWFIQHVTNTLYEDSWNNHVVDITRKVNRYCLFISLTLHLVLEKYVQDKDQNVRPLNYMHMDYVKNPVC